MSEYTKGPWRVGRAGSVVADYPVPEMGGSDAVEYYGGHLIAESVIPSNARLLSAATEMLEALKALYAGPCSAQDEPERRVTMNVSRAAFKMMEAAIAKAEGK